MDIYYSMAPVKYTSAPHDPIKFWHTHLAQKRNMVEILKQCIHVTRGSWLETHHVLKLTLTCFGEEDNYLDTNYRSQTQTLP